MKPSIVKIDSFVVVTYILLTNPIFIGFGYTPWINIVGFVLAICNIILIAIAIKKKNTRNAWKILLLLVCIGVLIASNFYLRH